MPDYELRWNDVYQKYIAFAYAQDDQVDPFGPGRFEHPALQLAREITRTDALHHLMSLFRPFRTNYYARLEQFTNVARRAKLYPKDAELQEQLDGLQKELCRKELLAEYDANADAAVKALNATADCVRDRVIGVGLKYEYQIKLNQPSKTEFGLIADLLKEVKSISSELVQDQEAYITNTPATLSALRKDPPVPPVPKPGT